MPEPPLWLNITLLIIFGVYGIRFAYREHQASKKSDSQEEQE